ncbi:hypothetical protein AC1031_011225 [Aphanomyces cochlioides]|nr:hypothetical protein AC1031_011225 [Aphanomyces cochlioides]
MPAQDQSLALPADVILKIVLYNTDTSELMLRKTLRPHYVLRPLELLFQLSQDHDLADLWPSKKLTSSVLTSPDCRVYEEIIQYYTNVVVDQMRDVEWLQKHLNPRAKVEWIVDKLPASKEITHFWAGLNITRLSNAEMTEVDSLWVDVLTQLPHLTSLEVSSVGAPECIFEYAANIDTPFDDYVTPSMLFNIIKWFTEKPVKIFGFRSGNLWYIHDGLKQAFYQSV